MIINDNSYYPTGDYWFPELDQFIGTDLWVLMSIVNKYDLSEWRYVNILSRKGNYITCRDVNASVVDDDIENSALPNNPEYLKIYIDSVIYNSVDRKLHKITIDLSSSVDMVDFDDILTTDEIRAILTETYLEGNE